MIKAWASLIASIGATALYFAEKKYYTLYQFDPSHNALIIFIATISFITSMRLFWINSERNNKIELEEDIILAIDEEDLLLLSIAIKRYVSSKHFNRTTLIFFNFEAQKKGKTECIKLLHSAILKTYRHPQQKR